jgi:soluble lytic murein transglycosylase-like protein
MSSTSTPRRRRFAWSAAVLACAFTCGQAHACWEEAGARYGVNPYLLYAIAKTESSLNPAAIGPKNRNGTYDIGLMQINSSWLPILRRYGIGEAELLDACTNIQVGAWILSGKMQQLGNSWTAVGAYNAGKPNLRVAYAQKVYRNLPRVALEGQR